MIRYNLYVAAHIAALAGQEKQADRCSAQRMPAIKSSFLLNLETAVDCHVEVVTTSKWRSIVVSRIIDCRPA